jgi:hypothetical protein
MRRTKGFLLLICILAGVVVAGCTVQNPGNGDLQPVGTNELSDTPVATPAAGSPAVNPAGNTSRNRTQLVAFVEKAVAYAHENGKEKALSAFSDRNGPFIDGELYIYAYDWNGTTIAHPVNPEKVGVNRLLEKDASGGYFIRNLRDTASNGSGFVDFHYINPTRNRTVEKKLGYVMKVDDDWWLGSGIYFGPITGSDTTSMQEEKTPQDLERTVSAVRANVTSHLEIINSSLITASGSLAEGDLSGPKARSALTSLYKASPYVVDCITVDPYGRVKAVVPPVYDSILGKSIMNQEHIRRLVATGKPVTSGVISTVEGFPAIDNAVPIYSNEGYMKGAVTLLYNTSLWRDAVLQSDPEGTYEVFVLQPDGLIVYDADPVQIGKYVFSDPLYAPYSSLLALARHISVEPSGTGTYTFTDTYGRVVLKEAVWDTVSLYGTDWRIVGARTMGPSAVPTGSKVAPTAEGAERLLIAALANGTSQLASMDRVMNRASDALGTPGMNDTQQGSILSGVCAEIAPSVDCLLMDRAATVINVKPERYRNLIGRNLMYDTHIQQLFATSRPASTNVIPLIEGTNGIAVSYPAHNTRNGEVDGAISLAVNPVVFFGNMFASAPEGGAYDTWVMQPDGLIVYDRDTSQIGRKLFNDPLYESSPSLLDLGRQMAVKESGVGTYSPPGGGSAGAAVREARWVTLRVYDDDYRLVVSRLVQG